MHMNKKRNNIKWLVIIELVVFYFSILNVISHLRGPVPYQIDTSQPIVQMQDFIPMAEMGIKTTATVLPIYNKIEGNVAGYTGELTLKDLQCLSIQFHVNCPSQFVGNTLIVDLYNYELNYDNPEQEHHIVLQEGLNNISIELLPGDTAPNTGELRIFTVNPAEYKIEGLKVYEKVAMPKVTAPMIVAVLVFGLLWIGTVIFVLLHSHKKE